MSPRPLKVFLCHAHADRDPVRGLYARLTQDGVDAWFDKAKLLPGQDWELEIRKAVREADVVVVCLSKQFNQAGFRQKEVRLALDTAMEKTEGEIFIIPARLEECDNLESLRKWHWVDLFEDDGYETLKSALLRRAEIVNAILLPSKILEINEAKSKAVLLEKNKSFSEALIAYIELKKLEPTYSGIDKKISEIQSKQKRIKWLISVGTATILTIVISVFLKLSKPIPFPVSTPAVPLQISVTNILPSLTSTFTSVPSPTRTLIPTATPVVFNPYPESTDYIDLYGVPMRLVAAGEFTMGNDEATVAYEKPAHQVYLDSFYIDKYEVTNILYKACVDSGACQAPKSIDSRTHTGYYVDPEFDNYPVIFVDWDMAKTYCKWRNNAKLPTEAQWEKAARGKEIQKYPWGNASTDNCEYANLALCKGATDVVSVGRFDDGKSIYGVFDLAGNVAEWVNDIFIEGQNYYTTLPPVANNPLGPSNGWLKVLRGGSWRSSEKIYGTVSYRGYYPQNTFEDYIGFRCARDVTP